MVTEAIEEIKQPTKKETKGGNYFISNYPPFSFWTADSISDSVKVLDQPPAPGTNLGLYIHIPFCRKRCHFCYFKVYTDKNATDIRRYIAGLQREMSMYADKPFINSRPLDFIYFGGGTPSYISARQLQSLVGDLKEMLPWDQAKEIAFECEPGTLSEEKLRAIKDIGVTRLSLGVENFDNKILEINGRAHRSPEIMKTYDYAKSIDFHQINIDLIAGMVNETDENWQRCIEQAIEMEPESITVYQMEIPFNTTIYKEMKEKHEDIAPVADWMTKRRWVTEAFDAFEDAGYTITSGYTAVKDPSKAKFLYRDYLWTGADMIGLGVASFFHIGGIHFQNEKDFVPYLQKVEEGQLPIRRAYQLSKEEQFIREFILQLKLGYITRSYFKDKFDVDIYDRFGEQLREIEQADLLTIRGDEVQLNREGLLVIDGLLEQFYLPEHQGARYT